MMEVFGDEWEVEPQLAVGRAVVVVGHLSLLSRFLKRWRLKVVSEWAEASKSAVRNEYEWWDRPQ